MSRLQWHRSLYWRIALGLFAFLALMLTAQGALFLWMTDRIAGSMPARSPRRLAALVASDVSAALNANASLKLEQYLPEQYGEILQTFVIIMRDGRTFSNHNDVPDALLEAVREEQRFMNERPRGFGRRGDGPGPFGGGPGGGDPGGPFDAGPGPPRPRPPDGEQREPDGDRPRHRAAGRTLVLENPHEAWSDDGACGGGGARRRHDGDRVRGVRSRAA